jgi:hypothetical protein
MLTRTKRVVFYFLVLAWQSVQLLDQALVSGALSPTVLGIRGSSEGHTGIEALLIALKNEACSSDEKEVL